MMKMRVARLNEQINNKVTLAKALFYLLNWNMLFIRG